MNLGRKFLLPFGCMFVLGPASIFLHECGHYVAAIAFGLKPTFHFALVQLSGRRELFTPQANLVVAAAGPLAGLGLGVMGYLWLRRLREPRWTQAATFWDGVASSLALNLCRGFRGFTGPAHPQPNDEAAISKMLGLPAWFVPYLLALFAVMALVAIVRLHAPGHRLVPILGLMLGGITGMLLWTKVVGPMVFP